MWLTPGPKGSRLKVVITDFGFPSVSIEQKIIESAGGELAAFHCKTESEVMAATGDADALIVQWAPITRQVIHKPTALRMFLHPLEKPHNIVIDEMMRQQ